MRSRMSASDFRSAAVTRSASPLYSILMLRSKNCISSAPASRAIAPIFGRYSAFDSGLKVTCVQGCAGCADLQSLRCGVLCAKAFVRLRPQVPVCISCHFAAMMGDGIRALVLRTPKLLLACSVVACFCATAYAQVPENLYQDMHWRMIGPFRGGRTRAASGVATQPNVFYIGAVDGGVWHSNDYGRTWRPIFDSQNTQSIGAIAVAPSDPNVIYVASGECLHRPDLSVGNGVYKSEDAGKTWQHLGLRDGQQFPALAVDPHDPHRVFAAVLGHPYGANAERGIFRSTDGGKSWTKVLYKDQNTGGYDVEINPANPNVVYATLWQDRLGPSEDNNSFQGTNGGVFKSTDGGDTW